MKKVVGFILIGLFLFQFNEYNVFAEEAAKLEKRTKYEIVSLNKNLYHSGTKEESFTKEKFITMPSSTNPYSSGKLTNDYLNDGLNAINMSRYIAGFPADITLDSEYNNYAQHGAVLLAALDTIDHYPSKPSDMSKEFYDLGYQGTSNSNLSAVWYFDNNYTIAKTIMDYMDDSDEYNISVLGHRRWILSDYMQYTGLGYATNSSYGEFSACYIYDGSRTKGIEYDYIAWPAVENHPTEYFGSNQAWSVSLSSSKYAAPSYNNVQVALKRLSDNKSWTFNKSVSNGYFNVDNNWCASENAIIFMPDNITEFVDGDEFEVKITGITDIYGNAKEIEYTTEFFDINRNKDINKDGKVDVLDLSLTAISYNKANGENAYNDECDFNRDEFIDLLDLVELSKEL